MLKSKKLRYTKKSKKNVRKKEMLEDGELEDETFNCSASCEAKMSSPISENEEIMQEQDCEEDLEEYQSEEEVKRSKKRHHRRQRRKYKISRSKDRKFRRKKRKNDSISDTNDSSPLHKRKRSERILKLKKHNSDSFRDHDPDIRRSSGSPMTAGTSLRMRDPAVAAHRMPQELPFLSRSSSLNLSQSRTSTPYPGNDVRRKDIGYSSESDSCYSELEMHLKQRHELCSLGESSRNAGSKCGFVVEEPEQYHVAHEPPHPSFRRSAPPKDIFIRNENEDPPPLELIEGRFRRHPEFPEQRREFFPRYYEDFHPPKERFGHHLHHPPIPDCSCRRHHHYPEMFRHRDDRRFVSPHDIEEEQRHNSMQYDNSRKRNVLGKNLIQVNYALIDLFHKIRGSFDPLPKRSSPPVPISDKPEVIKPVAETGQKPPASSEPSADEPPVEATSKNPSPSVQETAFKPTTAFQQTLEQHIRNENWVEASKLLFFKLAGDRNHQEGRLPSFNMPLPPPLLPLGNGLLPIPDSQMMRPHPMANFPPPTRMILPGQRLPPLVHLPPNQGPMPPMLPPVVQSMPPPPPWLPQQMFIKQNRDQNATGPPPLQAPAKPTLTQTSSNLSQSSQNDISNNESAKCSKDEGLPDNNMDTSKPTTSEKEDDDGKKEDIITLDDPDVISVASDVKKSESSMDHEPSHEICISSASLLSASKTSEINPGKSDDSWSYSSDEDRMIIDNVQEKRSASSISSPVQSIFDIISKKQKIKSSSIDRSTSYLNRPVSSAHQPSMTLSDVSSPSNLSPMTSSLPVNLQKGSGSTASSIRLILKPKKSGEDFCELRKEPVNIPLDVNWNLKDSTSCIDPRKAQNYFGKKEMICFCASIPAFGCKAANICSRAKQIAPNSSSNLHSVADVSKNDPRVFCAVGKPDKTGSEESNSQVFTPIALLTKPTTSLEDCMPDLNIELAEIDENEPIISKVERPTQELPKLPTLVRARPLNCNKIIKYEKESKLTEYFPKTSETESPDFRATILPEKATGDSSKAETLCEKTNIGHLPKLIPAPTYATRLREAQSTAGQKSSENY